MVTTDFTAGEPADWTKKQQGSDKITYDKSNGAVLTVARQSDSPTFQSKNYIFYGKADVVMKAAPGVGIISSLFLTSDCLDEIDFVRLPTFGYDRSNTPQEVIGMNHTSIQSNYFRAENTTTYDRGGYHNVNAVDEFHKYTLEYTPAGMTFSIDDAVVRSIAASSLAPQKIGSPSPQTPMFVRIGIWASGDPTNKPGTISWGGGPTDYSQSYSMYIKSITMTNYSPAKTYSYQMQGKNETCNEGNIAIDGGTLMSQSDGAAVPPPPPAGGSSSAAAKPTDAPTTAQKEPATTSAPADTLAPPPSTPKPTTAKPPASNTTAKPSPSPSPSKAAATGAGRALEAARGLGLAALLLGASLLLV